MTLSTDSMLTTTTHRVLELCSSGAGPGWLTGGVAQPQLVTAPVETRPDVDATPDTDDPKHAHIVKVGPGESAAAKVLEARIYGTPVEALCGFVWVPSRDPQPLPVCQKCRSVYDLYRAFNDGLGETPDE